MTPEEEIRRADKAKQILENEMFKEAFSEIETAILIGLRQTAFKDEKLREKLCARYDLLHSLKDQLRTLMESGVLAEEELRRKTISDRVRLAWDSLVA